MQGRRFSSLPLGLTALALIGAALGWAVFGQTDTPSSSPRPGSGPERAAAAALTEAAHPTSTAFVAAKLQGIESLVDRNGPGPRTAARSGRSASFGTLARGGRCALTSRARMAELAFREFATALAEARAGSIACRSTAPPDGSPHLT